MGDLGDEGAWLYVEVGKGFSVFLKTPRFRPKANKVLLYSSGRPESLAPAVGAGVIGGMGPNSLWEEVEPSRCREGSHRG